jgi:hypothetical protein
MLVMMAGIGYPAAIASRFVGPAAAWPLIIASNLCSAAGPALLMLFTWRVFRPKDLWARGLASAGVVAACALAGWRLIDVLSRADVGVTDGALGALLLMLLASLWATYESLRNYGMMRRRQSVGLGDSVVCNRFMLFGMMALCSVAGLLINMVALWMNVDFLGSPRLQLAGSFIGLLQAGAMLLTFAPPRFYLDWVRERPQTRAWAS